MVDQIREALYESGISLSLVYEIVALMEQKPLRVQRAFLLRLQGKTQQEIADKVGVSQQRVQAYFAENLADVCKEIQETCVLVL